MRTPYAPFFAKNESPPDVDRPDPNDLYEILYSSARMDYRRVKRRFFAKRTLLLVVTALSVVGTFSVIFYPTFMRSRISRMEEEISNYRSSILSLNTQIDTLSARRLEYEDRLQAYKNIIGKLKVEDDRIIDFDLTEEVARSTGGIDAIEAEYRNITRGSRGVRASALTFDLGTGDDLPVVYSILKRFDTRATVFLSNEMSSESYGSLFNGRNLAYLVKLNDLGCEFGNHTWSHYNLKRSLYETSKKNRVSFSFLSNDVLDELNITRELKMVEKQVFEKTGIVLSPLWRAPYGAIDDRILKTAAAAGYPNHIFWSANGIGPLDFYDYVTRRFVWRKETETGRPERVQNPYYFSSQEMLHRLKQWEEADPSGLNGAISIAHLGTSRKNDRMVLILPEYISHFTNRGYRFVTVTELLAE
ncbi:MAG: polysaccharide deacetylase family protein [Spirochaetes bacterium]|nr:polysaccharide deacetylase family protein [Spirochaetota bacterium]